MAQMLTEKDIAERRKKLEQIEKEWQKENNRRQEQEQQNQIRAEAENLRMQICVKCRGNPDLKKELLISMLLNATYNDSEILECIKTARERLAEREKKQAENAKEAKRKRDERMSFENQFPRMFAIMNNDPVSFSAWLSEQDSTDITKFLESMTANKRRYNEILDYKLIEATRVLEEELKRRNSDHETPLSGVRKVFNEIKQDLQSLQNSLKPKNEPNQPKTPVEDEATAKKLKQMIS